MTEDPIRRYIDLKQQLDQQLEKINKLQAIVENVARALQTPMGFMVSGTGTGFPPEVAMARGIPNLNAGEWPSAQQLAELLASLHTSYRNAQNAYLAIPEHDRKNVVPLPDRY